jgi:hypothetical protein
LGDKERVKDVIEKGRYFSVKKVVLFVERILKG